MKFGDQYPSIYAVLSEREYVPFYATDCYGGGGVFYLVKEYNNSTDLTHVPDGLEVSIITGRRWRSW